MLTLGERTPNLRQADVLIDDGTWSPRSVPGSAPATPSRWTPPTPSSCRASSTPTDTPRGRCSATSARPTAFADGSRGVVHGELPTGRRVRGDPHRPARCRRSRDHHRRRLVGRGADDEPRGRRAPGPRDAGLRTVFVHARAVDAGATGRRRARRSSSTRRLWPDRDPHRLGSRLAAAATGIAMADGRARGRRAAHPRPCRLEGAGRARSPRWPSGGSSGTDVTLVHSPASTTRTSTPSRRPEPRCRWRRRARWPVDSGRHRSSS